ncbi:SigB/SigF/SigG family RNA polymerase sigma factor [Planosporangium thailandense]|uniref:SigB/SigF/SigG family RNA polymerase sigma factor n=1 Tax=Planosporangium thailandense TaxID=765197 RepID=A0ABX0XWY8_9ACTN|nr:SigB/SigF/SigG family RNA polymerase sigma factor [Planosporangium thailandense]
MTIALDHAQWSSLLNRDFDERVSALVESMCALVPGDPARAERRTQLINVCRPLAACLARRYRNRGEPLDDLVQIATVGLIKAVDAYDPRRGVPFGSYAVPTIVGEIKRHFRDRGWAVRVPRRLQELRLRISREADPLTQRLGRNPTVADLAADLGEREEDIIAGLACAPAYRTVSLQVSLPGAEGAELMDVLGAADPLLEGVEHREALRPLIAQLPDRERRILHLRFFANMTQAQIAAATGISQMHVSRLLGQSLRTLRKGLLAD